MDDTTATLGHKKCVYFIFREFKLELIWKKIKIHKKEMAYNSTDVSLLLKEIQKTQDLLDRIKEMKQGMLGSAIVQIANEVSPRFFKKF